MHTLFEEIHRVFKSSKRIVITTHINPDGDAIGSEAALAAYLRNIGKEVTVLNQSATPDNLLFLSEIFPVVQFSRDVHTRIITDADCIIVLDTSSPLRFKELNDAIMKSEAFKICIDHHLEQEPFADLFVIDIGSPATSEILYRLLMSINEKAITRPIAEALYAGIMTDTGSFRFPKTTSETHQVTADLINRGVDPNLIYQQIYEMGPAKRVLLLGKTLSSLRTDYDGMLAYMVITRGMFAETKTCEADTDNMINYALNIGGVKIGLLFTELEHGVKVSFRSKGDIPINELAKEFGGNGHKNAAGARVSQSPLKDVINDVLLRAGNYLQ